MTVDVLMLLMRRWLAVTRIPVTLGQQADTQGLLECRHSIAQRQRNSNSASFDANCFCCWG